MKCPTAAEMTDKQKARAAGLRVQTTALSNIYVIIIIIFIGVNNWTLQTFQTSQVSASRTGTAGSRTAQQAGTGYLIKWSY